jgi:hypothetical protein
VIRSAGRRYHAAVTDMAPCSYKMLNQADWPTGRLESDWKAPALP